MNKVHKYQELRFVHKLLHTSAKVLLFVTIFTTDKLKQYRPKHVKILIVRAIIPLRLWR
jgi:hypothetical protein